MSIRLDDSTNCQLAVSLDFRPENILGRGSLETTIYSGSFGGRQVAIKVGRLQSSKVYTNTSWKETAFMTKLDDHQNIIRHLYTTALRDKSYIVTELCVMNLRDLITQDCGIPKDKLNLRDLLHQTTSGLAHIHANNIVHCNLTPTNILLNTNLVVKITNFESSLNVTDNLATATPWLMDKLKHNLEWTSPEVVRWTKENYIDGNKLELKLVLKTYLNIYQKVSLKYKLFFFQTTKVDLFNLGCIYYFTYTGGDHPYGARYERTQNIFDNNPQYRKISRVPVEFKSVIFQLNKTEPEERPSTVDILRSSCFRGASSETRIEAVFNKKSKGITYSETDMLGSGSLGTTVYKGAFAGREVAVKRIYNPKYFLEVENEIDILIKCEGHPNIVRYISSEKKSDCFLLALELCHKLTLLDWVDNPNCIPVKAERLEILRQVAQGLSYLHQSNIIHRDLKPSNILFFIQGKEAIVKIADFGISRRIFHGSQSRTFTVCGGTAGWTSPEMLIAMSGKHTETEPPKLVS